MNHTCVNCAYYQALLSVPGQGECRKPLPRQRIEGDTYFATWLRVTEDDWCGQGKVRKALEKKSPPMPEGGYVKGFHRYK